MNFESHKSLDMSWLSSSPNNNSAYHISGFVTEFSQQGSIIWLTIPFSCSKVTSICPSVRMEQLGFHWTDFHEIWYTRIFFQKSVEKIQVSLKSDKNMRWCSWLRHCDISQIRFPMGTLEFFIDLSLPSALWSWNWLSLWLKWVPDISLGGLRRPMNRTDDFTTLMCRLSINSKNLNLLDP